MCAATAWWRVRGTVGALVPAFGVGGEVEAVELRRLRRRWNSRYVRKEALCCLSSTAWHIFRTHVGVAAADSWTGVWAWPGKLAGDDGLV